MTINLVQYLPFLGWMRNYKRGDLPGDLIAGLTIATMLIPQTMAYALLAGLPPIVGLYTGILPVLVYGLLTSSRVLTLGPTAITSVMVLDTIGPLADQGPEVYLALSFTLALTLGIVFLLMGLFRLGFIVNVLSQPVLAGYVNAAALIIIFSQIQNITGISTERTSRGHELLLFPLRELDQLNLTTLGIGLSSLIILFYFRGGLEKHLQQLRLPTMLIFIITRSGPLLTIFITTTLVYLFRLNENNGVRIIGDIPTGFPMLGFGPFDFSEMTLIIPGAIAIAFVGFMEAISTAKSLTAKDRHPLDPNQELIAMGAANVASVASGGLACTTSISRSAVNYTAGAKTGLSSVIAAIFVGLAVTFFTPLFFFLPQATLAAIIVMSVANLIDTQAVGRFRRYSKGEPIPFVVTFLGSFFLGIEVGIAAGIFVSGAVQLYRTSRPPIIRLERVWNTESYADAVHYDTQVIPTVLIMRIDASLYFANAQHLDRFLNNAIVEFANTEHLILVCNAINTLDGSAIEILVDLIMDFEKKGVKIYIAEMKDRVLARVDRVNFVDRVGEHRFYPTTHAAVLATGKLDDYVMPI